LEFIEAAFLLMSTLTQIQTAARQRRAWLPALLVLSALIFVLYGPILYSLARQWWSDPDYGHGFLVPLFAGYVLWRERTRWMAVPLEPSNFGLLVMLGAVVILLAGSLGAELFLSRFSLIVLLTGMILFLAGWKMLRAVAFPLGFLLVMIPIPVIIYNQITFPLQLIASRFAASSLQLFHVPVLREGNLLVLPNVTLEVVEACSGIRSLMSLIALALAYGYLAEDRRWARWALVLLMFPIAVVSNGLRIMGTGILTYTFGPQAAEGFFHVFSGWVIFLVALVLMFAVHRLLRRIGAPNERANA
jgi:exosortase